MLVEQCQVEIELAREVLVQNGFGDSGAIGDLVHGRGVVAGLDEHLLGSLQLAVPAVPIEAVAHRVRVFQSVSTLVTPSFDRLR